MKIAIHHTQFQQVGGSERYIYYLVQRLLRDGHELHYYCSRRRDDFEHPNLHFHSVPRVRGVRWWKVLSFARNAHRALLRDGPFDVIHGFSKTYYQDVYTDGSGLQSVYRDYMFREASAWMKWIRSRSPYQLAVEACERRRFRRGNFQRILTMSRFVKEQIQGRYGLGDDEVEVLYNGIDCEEYHPRLKDSEREPTRARLGISPADCAVLFIGSDYTRKNLDVLMRAAVELCPGTEPAAAPAYRFMICGRDNHEESFRARARELGVEERFHFLGLQQDIRPYLAAADVLVLPTFYDVFGMVVLEAMAAGVPCIVSVKAGAAEIVEPGVNGEVLHDPTDATELATLLRGVAPESTRVAMGKAARQRALDFSWDRHMEELYRVYGEVAQRK